jgi:fucose permease
MLLENVKNETRLKIVKALFLIYIAILILVIVKTVSSKYFNNRDIKEETDERKSVETIKKEKNGQWLFNVIEKHTSPPRGE